MRGQERTVQLPIDSGVIRQETEEKVLVPKFFEQVTMVVMEPLLSLETVGTENARIVLRYMFYRVRGVV